MFGCHNHERYAVYCFDASCENVSCCQFFSAVIHNIKCHLHSFASANPITLKFFEIFVHFNSVNISKKFFGILFHFEKPNILFLLNNFAVTSVTNAALTVFIRKNGFAIWAIIDNAFLLVCFSIFKKFQKNPLRPLVIIFVTCAKCSVVIKGKTDLF